MVEFTINYILIPIVVLGIVIFFHELGHFLMARYYKISAPVFSVGFGREIAGFTDKHGTRWKLSIFPLGGYVSVDIKEKDAIYKRSLVAFAGPLANFILAVFLMIVAVNISGAPKTPTKVVAVSTVGGAYKAGILPGDKIISLDDHELTDYSDKIGDMVRNAKNDHIKAVVLRDNKQLTFSVPVRDSQITGDFGEDKNKRLMGVVFAGLNLSIKGLNKVGDVNTEHDTDLARAELIKHFGKNIVIDFGQGKDRQSFLTHVDPTLNQGLLDKDHPKYSTFRLWDEKSVTFKPIPFLESVGDAFDLLYQACKKTLGVLYQIIVGKKGTDDLGGVVQLSSMTGDVAAQAQSVSWYYMVRLIAILSINIGFMNLLPLPMLDGGHLMLHAVEKVRGRPLTPTIKGYVYGVGIMFILILSIIVTVRDIMDKMGS